MYFNDFGFRDQLIRAGLSVSSNLAGGYGCVGSKELVQFLRHAKGSAAELETQLYIDRLQAMLGGLIKNKTGLRGRNEE